MKFATNHFATLFLKGAVISVTGSAILAFAMTLIDWKENPAGLFHNQQGTNWAVTVDTAASWFIPSILILLGVTLVYSFARTLALSAKSHGPDNDE